MNDLAHLKQLMLENGMLRPKADSADSLGIVPFIERPLTGQQPGQEPVDWFISDVCLFCLKGCAITCAHCVEGCGKGCVTFAMAF